MKSSARRMFSGPPAAKKASSRVSIAPSTVESSASRASSRPSPGAAPAECPAPARREQFPRRHSANSRDRRAGGSLRSARLRSPARHKDRRTSDGAAAKDWRGGATVQLALARTRTRQERRGRCRRRTKTRGRRAIGRDRRRLPPRQALSSRAPGDAWPSPECRLRLRRGRARVRRSPRYGPAARRRAARAGRRWSESARPPPAPRGAKVCR